MKLRQLLERAVDDAVRALGRDAAGEDAPGAAELRAVLDDLPLEENEAVEVRGVCHDSRRAEPGDLYVAIVGERFDGREFAREAVARGAVAVLGPGPAPEGMKVPWIETGRPRLLLGPLATHAFGAPHESLVTVGVTGTNGKSTTAILVADALTAAGLPAAFLGTLGCHFGERSFDFGERTTPEAPDLFRGLDLVRREGARAAALEVSSHGLDAGRLGGLTFDVGVFTNLSRDHLDHHGDMESYFRSKKRLFDRLKDGRKNDVRAVVSAGDRWGRRLAGELRDAGVRVLTYGIGDGDVHVASANLDLEGIEATVETPGAELRVFSPLLGSYNLENLLATIAVVEALHDRLAAGEATGKTDESGGDVWERVLDGLARRGPIPGRLEPVRAVDDQPFPALVDYAHTPDALEAALKSLRQLTSRKIVLVFGCGGERDAGKREPMGKIAGELSDVPVLTSDNPRGEDALAILGQVEEGVKASGNDAYRMVPDRREAIRRAVDVAWRRHQQRRREGGEEAEGWLVLLAGKGHETTQDLGDEVVPFSDRAELETAIREVVKGGGEGGRRG